MNRRMTLPKQRAQETRQRIVEAAGRVFAREGYGEATVDNILVEAGISRGAFYHHFAGKEEVFKALLDDHLREDLVQLGSPPPATSLRELIERYVAVLIDHLEAERESSLSMEFWAAATREEWVRAPVAEFHRRTLHVIAELLRTGKASGVLRADLDVEGSAFLLQAIFEGTAVLLAMDPACIELRRLQQPWADLMERFLAAEGEKPVDEFQTQVAGALETLRTDADSSAPNEGS